MAAGDWKHGSDKKSADCVGDTDDAATGDDMRQLPPDATPNLGLGPNTTHNRVLLICGEDPDLVKFLMTRLGVSVTRSLRHREFSTGTCTGNSVTFTCCITGLGSASVEVALNELFHTGGRVFVHTGTAATLNPRRLPVGRAAIVEYAWRDDGASLHYVSGPRRRIGAHQVLLKALWASAESSQIEAMSAVGVSTDAFYGCSAAKSANRLTPATLLPLREGTIPEGFTNWLLPLLSTGEPLCLDMEVSTFYTLAALIAPNACVQWASVKGISNELPFRAGQQNEFTEPAMEAVLRIAVGALTKI